MSRPGFGGFLLLLVLAVGLAPPEAIAQAPAESPTANAPAETAKPKKSRGTPPLVIGSSQSGKYAPGVAHTSVYGLEGDGFKFVYVFDRSASMGGGAGSPLAAAKAELWKSLEKLGPTHQFQIIFYNEKPKVFSPSGQSGRLVFATEQNKKQAYNFIQAIGAEGGTEHEDALDLALRMHPDVVFFLTDADEPAMSQEQLLRIQRKNQVAAVHCIEFGERAAAGEENFLARLAHENGGQYVYIDIAKPEVRKTGR